VVSGQWQWQWQRQRQWHICARDTNSQLAMARDRLLFLFLFLLLLGACVLACCVLVYVGACGGAGVFAEYITHGADQRHACAP
jgi:hypothetical protein